MISRKNYVTILVMMVVLFFLFLFSSVIREALNEYQTNEFDEATKTRLTHEDVVQMQADKTDSFMTQFEELPFIESLALISGEGLLSSTVEEWSLYSRKVLNIYLSLREMEDSFSQEKEAGLPQMLLLDCAYLSFDEWELAKLQQYVDQEIHLVFCNIPSFSTIIENMELRQLMGIRFIVKENVSLTGIRMFEGFLLGGEVIYRAFTEEEEERQDMVLSVPWYVTGGGTRTYMVGLLEDEAMAQSEADIADGKYRREHLPAIIWRNSIGRTRIFVVNGDYLEGKTGLGILSAMMTQIQPYSLDAVVNAQNMVFVNYPGIASENNEEMQRLYSRKQKEVNRDIIWPGLVSVADRLFFRATCMLVPQLDYTDDEEPLGEDLEYYMRMMKEHHMEVGLSGSRISNTALGDKWRRDHEFLEQYLPGYPFISIFLERESWEDAIASGNSYPLLGNVRTVLRDYGDEAPVITYIDEDITLQNAVFEGFTHTFSDNLRLRSMETALGYSSIVADMKQIGFPESEEYSWEKKYRHLSSNAFTYWGPFEVFERTTLAESDRRIREFMALKFTHSRKDHLITVEINNFIGGAWFLLRTHGEEIDFVNGGVYNKVEDFAYLIYAEESVVEIGMEGRRQPYYYDYE